MPAAIALFTKSSRAVLIASVNALVWGGVYLLLKGSVFASGVPAPGLIVLLIAWLVPCGSQQFSRSRRYRIDAHGEQATGKILACVRVLATARRAIHSARSAFSAVAFSCFGEIERGLALIVPGREISSSGLECLNGCGVVMNGQRPSLRSHHCSRACERPRQSARENRNHLWSFALARGGGEAYRRTLHRTHSRPRPRSTSASGICDLRAHRGPHEHAAILVTGFQHFAGHRVATVATVAVGAGRAARASTIRRPSAATSGTPSAAPTASVCGPSSEPAS